MTGFFIVAAWALYGAIGPVFVSSDRNRHNAIAVWLRKETPGQHQPSIRVQEVGEWRFGKIVGVAIGLVAASLAPPTPAAAIVVFMAMLIADSFTRLVKQVDWAGHGAEVMNAEAEGIAGYREAEAARVARDYGTTPQRALQWFDQMRWLSRILYTLARW